ncbi:MAG: TIGR01244 family sulfur transferase [Pseudomonadota bacterium]|nr:TIGR01244 family sulfur transferase [Pseudomonadota bacterium]
MLRRIDERVLVAGQIRRDDMEALKAGGIGMIVNNRPDDEEAGQPSSAEMEAAARAAGIDYRYIPVASGFSANQVEAMSEALRDAEGQILAFCRSGTRSTYLWALARARHGDPAEELMQKAAAAGYDLGPIEALLQR